MPGACCAVERPKRERRGDCRLATCRGQVSGWSAAQLAAAAVGAEPVMAARFAVATITGLASAPKRHVTIG